jgi:hypothetical protein
MHNNMCRRAQKNIISVMLKLRNLKVLFKTFVIHEKSLNSFQCKEANVFIVPFLHNRLHFRFRYIKRQKIEVNI